MIPILVQDKTMTLIVLPTPPSISLSHGSSSVFSLAEDLTLELYSCNHICMDEIGPDWRWERYSRVFCRGRLDANYVENVKDLPEKTLSPADFLFVVSNIGTVLYGLNIVVTISM